MDALQQQLHALATQRDAALLELAASQEAATASQTSLNNLQMVLEQFQHGESGLRLMRSAILCEGGRGSDVFAVCPTQKHLSAIIR